jgi:hypothetical protein
MRQGCKRSMDRWILGDDEKRKIDMVVGFERRDGGLDTAVLNSISRCLQTILSSL